MLQSPYNMSPLVDDPQAPPNQRGFWFLPLFAHLCYHVGMDVIARHQTVVIDRYGSLRTYIELLYQKAQTINRDDPHEGEMLIKLASWMAHDLGRVIAENEHPLIAEFFHETKLQSLFVMGYEAGTQE